MGPCKLWGFILFPRLKGANFQAFSTFHHVPSGHKSTSQRWINVDSTLSLNHPQPSSTLIFGWEIVDFETIINQKSTSQPKINQNSTKNQLLNQKSTKNQPNFNHFSTLISQLHINQKSTIHQPHFNHVSTIFQPLKISTLNQPKINHISTLIQPCLNRWKYQPQFNQKSTKYQPHFNHISTPSGHVGSTQWALSTLNQRWIFNVEICNKNLTLFQRWNSTGFQRDFNALSTEFWKINSFST